MNRNSSLLERLDGLEGTVLDSIKRNLDQIFITRQGSVLTQVDSFGIEDFNHYNSRIQAAPEIAKMIKKNINMFEPRLKNVRVSFDNQVVSKLLLNFHIHAYTVEHDVEISIVLTEAGNIKVQK